MLCIVLVEDEGRIRAELAELLGALPGVKVVGCVNSESAAIDELMIDRHHWDLAVVDLALSTGNGLRVLSAVRVRQSHQRIVVLNDRSTEGMRRQCIYFGANAVFDKVSDVDALLEYCRVVASEAAKRSTLTPRRFFQFFARQWRLDHLSLFKKRPRDQELSIGKIPV